jgi:hypothetical protein
MKAKAKGSPKKSIEEQKAELRAKALATLEKHKDDLKEFEHTGDVKEEKWQREADLLERRVKTNTHKVKIGKEGETIEIRISLSDYEVGEIVRLDNVRSALDIEEDIEKINEITYIILGAVTANPMFTAEWFANNRRKYSTEDMLAVTLSYFESMDKRAKRVAEIQEFR